MDHYIQQQKTIFGLIPKKVLWLKYNMISYKGILYT